MNDQRARFRRARLKAASGAAVALLAVTGLAACDESAPPDGGPASPAPADSPSAERSAEADADADADAGEEGGTTGGAESPDVYPSQSSGEEPAGDPGEEPGEEPGEGPGEEYPEEPGGETPGGPGEPGVDEDAVEGDAAFMGAGEMYRYTDGLEITLWEAEPYTPTEGPYDARTFRIRVTVDNYGDTVNDAIFGFSAHVGGTEAIEIHDPALAFEPVGALAPGEHFEAYVVFDVPERLGPLDVTVDPLGVERETLYWILAV